jgi:hypothetical protein
MGSLLRKAAAMNWRIQQTLLYDHFLNKLLL